MATIKILSDVPPAIKSKSSNLPMSLDKVSARMSEVTVEQLQKNIDKTVKDILSIVSGLNQNAQAGARLDEVKFSLSIGSEGEVALFSIVKGSINTSVGIEFTIKM